MNKIRKFGGHSKEYRIRICIRVSKRSEIKTFLLKSEVNLNVAGFLTWKSPVGLIAEDSSQLVCFVAKD